MADTTYNLNDPESVKLWARKLDREAPKRTYLKRFMGESQDSLIQIKNETNKQRGDKIYVTLRKQLRGRGIVGDGTLEGNEESLSTFVQALEINQLRHAVRSAGAMTQQRVTFDLRTKASSDTAHPVLWYDLQKQRISGGERDENPIFSGALGEYNNCILHESTHIPKGVSSATGLAVSNTRRAVLCGAQAAIAGFGMGHDKSTYDWFEQHFDYGNKLGVKAGCISGLRKSMYTESGSNHDFGVVVMSSYAAAHT
jgi:hypothetical protein